MEIKVVKTNLQKWLLINQRQLFIGIVKDSDSMGVTFLSGDEKFVVANLGGLVENENVGDICCQYFYYKLLNFYLSL